MQTPTSENNGVSSSGEASRQRRDLSASLWKTNDRSDFFRLICRHMTALAVSLPINVKQLNFQANRSSKMVAQNLFAQFPNGTVGTLILHSTQSAEPASCGAIEETTNQWAPFSSAPKTSHTRTTSSISRMRRIFLRNLGIHTINVFAFSVAALVLARMASNSALHFATFGYALGSLFTVAISSRAFQDMLVHERSVKNAG